MRSRPLVFTAAAAAFLLSAQSAYAVQAWLSPPERLAGVDGGAEHVDLADVDGDGLTDIVMLAGRQWITVVRGRPSGWAPAQTLRVTTREGAGSCEFAIADIDDDGDDDIVLACGGSEDVAVIRGAADGVLRQPADSDRFVLGDQYPWAVPDPAAHIDAGDLDQDGVTDVVISSGHGLRILRGTSEGVLGLEPQTPDQAAMGRAQLAMLGGDDDLDLISTRAVQYPNPQPGGLWVTETHLDVRPGGPGLGFGSPWTLDMGDRGMPVQLAVGDVDGDGVDDVGVSRFTDDWMTTAGVGVYFGDAAGPQVVATPAEIDAHPTMSQKLRISLDDLDRDGDADALVSLQASNWITGYASNAGLRGFDPGLGDFTLSQLVDSWVVGDVDGDEIADTVVVTSGAVQVFYGAGPELNPDADADFGTVDLGRAAPARTITFENAGPGKAEDLEVAHDGDADFAITQDTCTGRTLNIGERCSVTATFSPVEAGVRELDVAVTAWNSDHRVWAAFAGTGRVPGTPTQTPTPGGPRSEPTPTAAPQPRPLGRAGTITRSARPRVSGHPVRVLATGLTAACAPGAQACRVEVMVSKSSGGASLGHLTRRIAAGKRARLQVRLTAAGRRTFARHRTVHVLTRTTVSRTGSVSVTDVRRATIRAGRASSG